MKDKPSLAKLKAPEKEIRQGNTTRLTIISSLSDTNGTEPPLIENVQNKQSIKTNKKLKSTQLETTDLVQTG